MSNGGRILPLPSPNKLSIGATPQKFPTGTDSVVQIMQELQANQKSQPMNLLTPSTIGQHKGQVFFDQGITPPIFKAANSVGKQPMSFVQQQFFNGPIND